MADKKIICGIDVGTTKIVAIIAEYDGESISVVGFGETPSIGLERGVIVNVPKTINNRIINARVAWPGSGFTANNLNLITIYNGTGNNATIEILNVGQSIDISNGFIGRTTGEQLSREYDY